MQQILLSVFLLLFLQEGHPLTGTWHGDWGPTPTHRNDVTLVLDWDGKNITGLINPGPESIKLSKATMEPSSDPKGWKVHFEADAKDHDGKPVHFVIDGSIENLTSIRRSIVGTWSHGDMKGDFKLTRDQ
ncbi:MAG: hypothetical protein DMG14_00455 [Acidobacteria bacterium]|nr:MAG: hypothetical protein DMG14_00455 [Acidobacteriota bacterium]